MVDAHSHAYRKDAAGIADWVRLMDEVGVRTSLILTGATGERFRSLSAQYAEAHPGRFVILAGFVRDGVEYQDRILFGTDNGPGRGMYLAHARQLETEDEWFWPPDAEWWRGNGMNLPPDVLRKVYSGNAERLLQ